MLGAMSDKHPAFVRVREDTEAVRLGGRQLAPKGSQLGGHRHRGISKLSLLRGPEVDISERCRAFCVLCPLPQGKKRREESVKE